MAAGMGSRYGGPKQIDPVTDKGEIIIDFSLYDAMMAGFEDVVFVIKPEIEEAVRALVDDKAGKHMNVKYVFQELSDLPEGYTVPAGREKPWGTCHAIMAARHVIDGPFAVINADDYYGSLAFQLIFDELSVAKDDEKYRWSMVGYELSKTLTENGHVARGVCRIGADGNLAGVDERVKIARRDGKIKYTEDDINWIEVAEDSVVSMNFWGFTPSIMKEMIDGFPAFLDSTLSSNPLKGEYLLPLKVDELLQKCKAEVKVLSSPDKWFGVTYKEDKEGVVAALQALKDKGEYPDELFK
jgi:hypothetical protein